MVLGKSITFDGDELGQAIVSAPAASPRTSVDLQFLDRLRSGEEAAFEVLVDRYSGDIYAVLYRLTDDPEEAADLMQDTFLRALGSVKSFRGDSELKTWLIRIAINQSRNRFRWWKRRHRDTTVSLDANLGTTDVTVGDMIAGNSTSPEQAALNREREAALQKALLEISRVYREALVLSDIEGLSYEATALALDCSIGTVKSRISRGREELRKKLKDL